MPEPLKKSDTNAQPMPPTGSVDILVVREGLAMVMDGLRVMATGNAKLSHASVLSDGRICLLPMIEIPGHVIGIKVMEVMEGGKTVKKQVFTTDGFSVMEVMDK